MKYELWIRGDNPDLLHDTFDDPKLARTRGQILAASHGSGDRGDDCYIIEHDDEGRRSVFDMFYGQHPPLPFYRRPYAKACFELGGAVALAYFLAICMIYSFINPDYRVSIMLAYFKTGLIAVPVMWGVICLALTQNEYLKRKR